MRILILERGGAGGGGVSAHTSFCDFVNALVLAPDSIAKGERETPHTVRKGGGEVLLCRHIQCFLYFFPE